MSCTAWCPSPHNFFCCDARSRACCGFRGVATVQPRVSGRSPEQAEKGKNAMGAAGDRVFFPGVWARLVVAVHFSSCPEEVWANRGRRVDEPGASAWTKGRVSEWATRWVSLGQTGRQTGRRSRGVNKGEGRGVFFVSEWCYDAEMMNVADA